MRKNQEKIYNAIAARGNWNGENTSVTTNGGVTTIVYYWTTIAVINHTNKTAKIDNGGYNTVSTTSRINAVKKFCEDKGYHYSVK
jgi:hypothetical protein